LAVREKGQCRGVFRNPSFRGFATTGKWSLPVKANDHLHSCGFGWLGKSQAFYSCITIGITVLLGYY
jgi:hypothetical protein